MCVSVCPTVRVSRGSAQQMVSISRPTSRPTVKSVYWLFPSQRDPDPRCAGPFRQRTQIRNSVTMGGDEQTS